MPWPLRKRFAGWTLALLAFVLVGGVAAGWGLARPGRLPGWLAALLLLLLGVLVVLARVARLDRLLWQMGLRWQEVGGREALAAFLADLTGVALRLGAWMRTVLAGEAGYDPVAAATVWGLLLWLVAAWASGAVRRGHPLRGLLPAGVLLALVLSFAGHDPSPLLPLLGALLGLMIVVGHAARERRWEADGIDFSSELWADQLLMAAPLALAIVALAGVSTLISPASLLQGAQRLFESPAREVIPLARSVGLEPRRPRPTLFDTVRAPGLPRRHLIGSGPELGEQPVMRVTLEMEPPAGLPPLRWRALTYDLYSGRGWSAGGTERVAYDAGERTRERPPPAHQLLRQRVEIEREGEGLLYTAGTLLSASAPFSVAWRTNADPFGATVAAAAYESESAVPLVGAAQRRAPATPYPEWVRRRYLRLPDGIPGRVLVLARDLTATAPTPFDRAQAIERYLRTIPYDLEVPAPPPGREVTDFFLFDLRRGYCDYYATAMVVLARAAGLPARLVVGYASGDYDAAARQYRVSEAEAHSWAEVYFADIGWVEFEPTAARPAAAYTEGDPVAVALPERPAAWEGALAPWLRGEVWLRVLLGAVGLLGGGAVLRVALAEWRLRRAPPAEAIALGYGGMHRAGQRLTRGHGAGETPWEFVGTLSQVLRGLASGPRWRPPLDPAPREAEALTELYLQRTYAPTPPEPEQGEAARRLWLRLRWRLWLAWLAARLPRA